ncbi:D-alanine--D-alanine ligase family protein [[Clostridium] polysaccharolyticum]|uniref:D-alanine--D-alanine ligase n=1 Tax=[Clostridium] polysaccharolyticum TaxID=29364 RepID=A0A1I0AIL5_9FIRM|nr:D-alanine--D-alanine ligase [[Clostridium] polysaccharolyticum]SES93102.1 D-alanine-D-alanine ligase [[Clostridium] polysaccharolyticum]
MNIVVLAGGTSTERDVSLITGTKVYEALKQNGHNVILVDLFLGLEEMETVSSDIFTMEYNWVKNVNGITAENPDIEQVKAMRKDKSDNIFGAHVLEVCQMADMVFMALHGSNGEDGRIQATFDLMGIPYTGTGYLSSALAMDKGISRKFFQSHDVPVAAGTTMTQGSGSSGWNVYPCIVKPCCGGSSVGVSIAHNLEEFKKALADAFAFENEVVVEQFIKGREFSVGVIEGKALPIIEIAPIEGFYDYKNKYQAGSTVETCPAVLTEDQTRKMQMYAERAYEALGIESYARIDFMMDESGKMYCLEANTLPGMTPTSLLPQEAAVIGYDFNQLCDWILKVSKAKYTK